jgi:hypothetical protein
MRLGDGFDVEMIGGGYEGRIAATGTDELAVWARTVRAKFTIAQHGHGPPAGGTLG